MINQHTIISMNYKSTVKIPPSDKFFKLQDEIQQELNPIFDEFVNKVNSIVENKGFIKE